MIDFPNAKINLGLNILEKRPDGYHNIESCFVPVGWSDVLEILPSDSLQFTASGIPIPGNPADNLCLKAYRAVAADYPVPPVHIHLHKVIPIGAGLGGGSADGAYTVKLLNDLFSLGLSLEEMENYVRPLGSDCAFFIRNQATFCYGKGDQFADIRVDMSKYHLALVNPPIHVSTAEAYSGIWPAHPDIPLREILQRPVAEWRNQLQNDFEKTVFARYPEIASIKEELYGLGAIYASMSGSGATVYGLFERKTDIRRAFPESYLIWTSQ